MVNVEKIKLGDIPAVWISSSESKASIKVALLGGTVYSYVTADGVERMYMSSDVVTDGSKGIRGGIPIVFPQFGPGKLKQHGFARWMSWEFDESSIDSQGDKVSFEVKFCSNEETRKLWNYDFLLVQKITFSAHDLETRMTVINTGESTFRFQYLLHTYHLLPCDIEEIVINGVAGMKNLDKLKQVGEMLNYYPGKLKIKENHDSIYINESLPNRKISVANGEGKLVFEVEVALENDKEEQPADVVIWNPWIAKAKAMSDFGDEEYRKMVCIEPGCVSRYEACVAKGTWSLYQRICYY